MKKEKILEIIDDENNIIGNNDIPETGKNKETEAKGSTDSNVGKHGQNFKNDFLGRFGFYFYEGKYNNKNLVEKLNKNKKDNSIVKHKKNDLIRKEKLKKIAKLLDNLSDGDVEKLFKILEENRKIKNE